MYSKLNIRVIYCITLRKRFVYFGKMYHRFLIFWADIFVYLSQSKVIINHCHRRTDVRRLSAFVAFALKRDSRYCWSLIVLIWLSYLSLWYEDHVYFYFRRFSCWHFSRSKRNSCSAFSFLILESLIVVLSCSSLS